jgi:hypothetical protein
MMRNGVFRSGILLETVEDSDILTQAAAETEARELLMSLLTERVEISFDSKPIPILEPGDMINVQAPSNLDGGGGWTMPMRANTFSIALNAENPMPVGYTRQLKRTSRRRPRVSSWGGRKGRR